MMNFKIKAFAIGKILYFFKNKMHFDRRAVCQEGNAAHDDWSSEEIEGPTPA